MEVRYYTKAQNFFQRIRSKAHAWHNPGLIADFFSLEVAHGEAVDPWWDHDKENGLKTWAKTELLVKGMSDGSPVLVVACDGDDIVVYYPDRTLVMETEEIMLGNPFRAAELQNENGMERTKVLRFKLREPWSAEYC